MWILEWWKSICQGLKPLFLQLCFNFSYMWLRLNILVLLNFFLSRWVKGMKDPHLIKIFLFNGMEIIFQGIQFFFKFIFHSFHDLFQLQQLEFNNFTFFQFKGDIWRFGRCINFLIKFFHVTKDNNYLWFSLYSYLFHFFNHPKWIS